MGVPSIEPLGVVDFRYHAETLVLRKLLPVPLLQIIIRTKFPDTDYNM